jgi:uncharacterized protein (DUF433 family)
MEVPMIGLDRVTFDPDIMGGRACIRGMRITVALILNLIANEMSAEEIIQAYPYLELEDIYQAVRYAAYLADESIYELEKVPA